MKEQFYINGILMDQASGKSASLVYQSPFFTDIDSIVSNRTNSVDFPTTENNLQAIQLAQLSAGTSKFAYRKHTALYFRDGVQIFSGFGTLLSITPTVIKFSFTWGNVNAFKKLLDIKLRDLQTDVDYVNWNDTAIVNDAHYPTNVLYQKRGYNGTLYKTVGHTHPVLKVSDILTRLSSASGVTFVGSNAFSKLAIPILFRKADEKAKAAQGINLISGDKEMSVMAYRNKWTFGCDTGAGDRDIKEQYDDTGNCFDVTDYNKIRIVLKGGTKFKTYRTAPSHIPTTVRGINVYATDENGNIGALIQQLRMDWNDLTADKSRVQYSVSEDKTYDIDLNWQSGGNTGKYNYIQLVPMILGNAYTCSVYDVDIDIDIICDYDQDQELLYPSIYPLYSNLPDWTASQLLKNLMKIAGVFAVCPDSETIKFVSIDALYNNRNIALDWTDKLMLTEGSKPEEISPTFGQYAQNNICKWAEDTTNLMTFNGALVVENETLEAEKDLFSLDFAGSDYSVTGDTESLRINCYAVNPNGDEPAEMFSEITPHIFEMTGRYARFSALDFKNISDGAYRTYQQTIRQPRVLKARVQTDVLDLKDLDLSVPVYSFALGHYYAINKLTTKDGYVADVELLQLGSLDTSSAEEPTSENTDNNLQVLRDELGNYYASIPSLTGVALNNIIADDNYRVVLLRYGYARRGKTFQYYDSRHDLIWSHAHRNRFYKNDRKGLQWRIIGYDILYEGHQGAHSQQVKTGYYNGSTLVFRLKESISLPPLRTDQKWFVTRDGHIRERSCDGQNDLYVALYHKESGKWVRVSNIVQVRGRNSDRTMIWEFEESNIIFSALA